MIKAILYLTTFSTLICVSSAEDKKTPNILIIFTDDQRSDTIHALGNPHIKTPNLDKLAKKSFVFNNAYCYGAHTGAVCIASRNQLMTGNTWHRWSPKLHCPTNQATMPKVMKNAGYETFYLEKSGRANHPEILKQFDHAKDIHNVNSLMTGRACKPYTDGALNFLKSQRNKDKPFLIYLGVSGPHDPRYAEKRFRDQYKLEDIPLPKNFKPLHHWDIGSMTIRDERLEKWPRSKAATKTHILDYYALVTAMDHDLGRLLDYMKQSGLDKETIIIFTSDHGLALGSHGLFGKQNVYEASMKVPFFISGPGINAGKTDALVYLHDIFPTIADYAGGKILNNIDGKSLRLIAELKKNSVRVSLSLAYQKSQRSIRDKRWKLMIFPQINRHQLFDLANDPDEIHNVALKFPKQVERLKLLLEKEQQLRNDTQPLTVAEPKPAKFEIPTNAKPYPRKSAGGESKQQTKN